MPGALLDPTDIVGDRFGNLVVAEFLRVEPYAYGKQRPRTRQDYVYRCTCDCGRSDVIARRVHLLTGHKKSCGCQWKPKGGQNWRWTGHGEISGVLWSKIRNHARYRSLSFEITIGDAWAKFLLQDRRCALTNVLLVFGTSTSEENEGGRTASLDRTDSAIGYTCSNIQWVHKDINQMKMDLKVTRFVELCHAVAKHSPQTSTLSKGARLAAQRPSNYGELSGEDQWAIDKELGILDWDGK